MQRNGNENQLGLNACMLAPMLEKGENRKNRVSLIFGPMLSAGNF